MYQVHPMIVQFGVKLTYSPPFAVQESLHIKGNLSFQHVIDGARFPLVLTCAKPGLFCQSQHRALPSLRKRVPDPTVALHPETARARQIAQGDWVSIATPAGRVRARAQLNTDLDPRVVVGEHGWWQGCAALGASAYDPFSQEGANFNLLIGSDTLDPISGTARIVPICARFDLLQKQKGQEPVLHRGVDGDRAEPPSASSDRWAQGPGARKPLTRSRTPS